MVEDDAIAKGLKQMEEAKNAAAVTAVKEDTATPEQENSVEYMICPCCGKPTLVKPVEVKGEIMDQFLCCIMTGVPFSHTYPVYKGKLEVTVTQLDREMADLLKDAQALLAVAEAKDTEHIVRTQDFINTLKLYCCISGIHVHAGVMDKTYTPQSLVMTVCKDICEARKDLYLSDSLSADAGKMLTALYTQLSNPATISSVPPAMQLNLVDVHTRLYNLLMDTGFDLNFWKGIELA